jgi:hypothetical protein
MVLSSVQWKENTGGYRAKQSGISEYQYISQTEIKPKISQAASARKAGINKYRAIH